MCRAAAGRAAGLRASGNGTGVPLEFLQEFEDKVPQSYPEHLIIVTNDVRRVVLNLDECLGFLEQDNVALGRVFHLNVTEAVLLQKKRERRLVGIVQARGGLQGRRIPGQLSSQLPRLAELNILETGIFGTPPHNSSD